MAGLLMEIPVLPITHFTATRLALFAMLSLAGGTHAALVVDLDAAGLPFGKVTGWPNSGSAGGSFNASGSPEVIRVMGVKCVTTFYPSDYLVGPAAPASVTGTNPARSVEVWAYNDSAGGLEETMISWGRRGGQTGSLFAFHYGDHPLVGALHQWDSNLPWIPGGGMPQAGRWHHLAVTSSTDGDVRLYVDGILVNSGTAPAQTLPAYPFIIGGQNETTGEPVGINYGLSLARVRVHDAALTAAEVAASHQNSRATLFPTARAVDRAVADAGHLQITVEEYAPGSVADPGSFTATVEGMRAGWYADGALIEGPATSTLTSPSLTVPPSGGTVTLIFQHRYDFEYDGSAWDAGAVRLSINGGPPDLLSSSQFTANGYVRSIRGTGPLEMLDGFNGPSDGYGLGQLITSTVILPEFDPGDTFSVQLLGSWDEGGRSRWPNWELGSLTVTAGAAPLLAADFSAGSGGFTAVAADPRGSGWRYHSGTGPLTIPASGSKSGSLTTLRLPFSWEVLRDYRITLHGRDLAGNALELPLELTTPSRAFAPESHSLAFEPDGRLRLRFLAKPHARYTLQSSTSLGGLPDSWEDLDRIIPLDVSGVFDPLFVPQEPFRFYRVRSDP